MPESILSRDAVYSAVPTVRVDGQANAMLVNQLIAMEMREREGGMSALELRFSNYGSQAPALGALMFEDGSILKLGATMQVFAGDVTSPTEIFRGKITALEGRFSRDGSAELVVLAEDLLQSARLARRTKTWDNATLADIATQVASQAGLTPVIDGLASNIGTQLQFNESDLHFLRRLLARYDADLQVSGTELHATSRAQAQRNTVEVVKKSQLREVRVVADLAHQVSEVTVSGWDYQQGQRISATSQIAAFGPGSGKNGKQWLEQALATRSQHLGQFAALDTTDAQALADAEFAQRLRRFLVAHGVSEGNPNLRVGTHLKLTGLGPRFDNTYYTSATTHRFDTAKGYETEFTAECAYLGGAA